jgi:REP element-mobilizing transposase RayT
MAGILQNKNCFCYQIGGVEDHVHIIFSLHPTIALSKLVQDLKVASNKMIKEMQLFKDFEAWVDGYSAFTYSSDARNNLIYYVQNQEQHHATKSLETELRELYKEHGIEIDERFFMKD